jgi:hypothetical protein
VDRAVPADQPPLLDPEVLPAADHPSLPPADACGPDLAVIYKSHAILVSL